MCTPESPPSHPGFSEHRIQWEYSQVELFFVFLRTNYFPVAIRRQYRAVELANLLFSRIGYIDYAASYGVVKRRKEFRAAPQAFYCDHGRWSNFSRVSPSLLDALQYGIYVIHILIIQFDLWDPQVFHHSQHGPQYRPSHLIMIRAEFLSRIAIVVHNLHLLHQSLLPAPRGPHKQDFAFIP